MADWLLTFFSNIMCIVGLFWWLFKLYVNCALHVVFCESFEYHQIETAVEVLLQDMQTTKYQNLCRITLTITSQRLANLW